EIIARHFRALAAVIGAVIDKFEHVEFLFRWNGFRPPGIGVLEIIAQRVSREAQAEPRFARSLKRFHCKRRTGSNKAQRARDRADTCKFTPGNRSWHGG